MSMDIVLQSIPQLDATQLFKEGTDTVLRQIEEYARSVDYDPATPEGRELGKSIAYKCARAKTMIDDLGKDLVAGIKAQSSKIDAEAKSNGFDVLALRQIIKLRKMDKDERAEMEAIIEVYMQALESEARQSAKPAKPARAPAEARH